MTRPQQALFGFAKLIQKEARSTGAESAFLRDLCGKKFISQSRSCGRRHPVRNTGNKMRDSRLRSLGS